MLEEGAFIVDTETENKKEKQKKKKSLGRIILMIIGFSIAVSFLGWM